MVAIKIFVFIIFLSIVTAVCARRKIQGQFTGTKIRGAGKTITAHQLKAHRRRSRRWNQMSRAQFFAKSGTLAASEEGAGTEEIEFAGLTGSVQIRTAGARSEIGV
jgi:hypothetical protein